MTAEARANAADVLIEAIERTAAPVCVGIDPVLDRLPGRSAGSDAASPETAAGALRDFALGVLDAVASHVPAVKVQSACFERYGHHGIRVLEEVVGATREHGLVVILDAKRGDVGVSAEHYAAAAFGTAPGREAAAADWITCNPYFGADGVRPFLPDGHGAFALVRTSNPGGDQVQARGLEGGGTVADHVAAVVAELGTAHVGRHGYSALGAVVGATKPEDAARLRAIMPQQVFLLPGYGAQGAGAEEVRSAFDERGRGAIVAASRAVIYAGGDDDRWRAAVETAARRFADDVGSVAGLR